VCSSCSKVCDQHQEQCNEATKPDEECGIRGKVCVAANPLPCGFQPSRRPVSELGPCADAPSSKRDDEKSRCSNQKTKRPEDRGDEIVACPDAHGVSGLTTQLTDCRCERALAANPTSKNPKACKLQRGAAVRCSVWFGKNRMHLERIGTIIRKAKSSVQRHRSQRRKATLSPGRSHLAVRRQKSSEKRTCCQEPHPQPQTR
jgi:hypothetical protein